MNTKGGTHPRSRWHPTKAVKSIPISAKSFRPVGPIQLVNTREKRMPRVRAKEFSPRPTESLKAFALSYSATLNPTGERKNVFRSLSSADVWRALDRDAAAKSFPLPYRWSQRDYLCKRASRVIWSFVRSFTRFCFAFRVDVEGCTRPRWASISQISSPCTLQNEFRCAWTREKNISAITERCRVSFPFPLTRTSRASVLFSSVDTECNRRPVLYHTDIPCAVSENLRGEHRGSPYTLRLPVISR